MSQQEFDSIVEQINNEVDLRIKLKKSFTEKDRAYFKAHMDKLPSLTPFSPFNDTAYKMIKDEPSYTDNREYQSEKSKYDTDIQNSTIRTKLLLKKLYDLIEENPEMLMLQQAILDNKIKTSELDSFFNAFSQSKQIFKNCDTTLLKAFF